MSFFQREADRLRSALTETPMGDRFNELYAAQQAIAWATDPERITSPLDMIQRFNNHEGSRDCPSPLHQA
jgi:hypothetical protein